MNIEQKSTLFIITLILAVLIGISSIALYLINGHIVTEANQELDSAYAIQQTLLHSELSALTRDSRSLSAQLTKFFDKKNSNTSAIRDYLQASRKI